MSRELHKHLVNPQIAGPICPVVVNLVSVAVADSVSPCFVATRRCKIIKASYLQESGATAVTTFVATLQVASVLLTAALDIKGLAADTAADFVVNDVDILDGEIVDLVLNETGGTVTAPDEITMLIELQLLE